MFFAHESSAPPSDGAKKINPRCGSTGLRIGFSLRAGKNFRIAKALCLRRAVGHPMKLRSLFLVVPFVLGSVWAAPVVDSVVLPEKVFPQLDAILKSAVQQSPNMLS